MSDIARRHFVRSQGLDDLPGTSCSHQYSALMFQPRVIAGIVLVAILLQSAAIFLSLALVLWWNVLMAPRNPFDALYNRSVAARRDLPRLGPAPTPRRFAQGMAGTILGGAGIALLTGWQRVAWVLEGLVVVALGALVLGRFCLGSDLYYRLRGRSDFANRTLPWNRAG
jgi:hypothetical protein